MSDLVWTPVTIRLGQIIPWTDNPRTSTKAQAERLIQSERELGQVQTIAVSPFDAEGKVNLYDGHQRYSAWLTIKGASYELTALQSNRHLTEDERRKMAILLHTATGGWNWDKMSGWRVGELKEWGLVNQENVKGWNTDALNVKELLKAEQETADAEPQIDRAAELLEKWGVKYGDLFAIGEHRLLCGDSTKREDVERVMGGERAVVMFTDPPYRMETQGGGALHEQYSKTAERIKDIVDFEPQSFLETLPFYFEKGYRSAFIFCNKDLVLEYLIYAKENKLNANILVWKKPVVVPFGDSHRPDIEYIIFFRHRAKWINGLNDANYSRCLEYPNQRDEMHPTVKPLKLVQNQLRITSENSDIVVDPFLGSGTTLVACQNLGRRGRGIEISPSYVAVTLQRMSDAFPHLVIERLK